MLNVFWLIRICYEYRKCYKALSINNATLFLAIFYPPPPLRVTQTIDNLYAKTLYILVA